MRYLLCAALCGVMAVSVGAAELSLTVSDTIGRAWTHEPIYWTIAFQPGEWQGGNVTVQRDGTRIPAQALMAERYADGSVKIVRVTVIIDRLEKDAKTVLTATLNAAGPPDNAVTVQQGDGFIILANQYTAIKLNNRNAAGGEVSPILGVRTLSGKWTGGGRYETGTAKPLSTKTAVLETGPVRAVARVTTTFENGRTHAVTVSLLRGAREIDVEETFDVGPDTMYQYKQYNSDPDELAWEWWSWYGDTTNPDADPHPNTWIFTLSSPDFAPRVARYGADGRDGDRSTDISKTDKGAGYDLPTGLTRIEKILEPIVWWQPDAVPWYAVSPSRDADADVIGLCANRARDWRNPNVLPVTNITLRTRTNAMRIVTEQRNLRVHCPIGLGARAWTIRVSDVAESYAQQEFAASALTATNVRKDFGLDVTRTWVTDWAMTLDYPRLFITPAEKGAYYARFKGKGAGMPGDLLNDFLHRQDQASFTRLYDNTITQADSMINGYYTGGVNGYPGWMLGYWHGIIVAAAMDNLIGSPFCTPEQAKTLKKKVAILTYLLAHPSNWPDKRSNFGWGSMNMPVGRWGGLVVMASSISDHPLATEWLKDADRYFRMLMTTEYSPDGTAISCPHYIGAASTSFYAWICLMNSGQGTDPSKSPTLRNFARYYMQLMTPIDARWGIRILNTEGDTRPGSSPLPGILATLFKESDPELAGQLITMWQQGGKDLGAGMGVPDALIIDDAIQPATPKLGPEVYPGFGAFLRYRAIGTPEESYLSFLAGNFMIDHTNCDQMAYLWYEKGVPLTLYKGDLYVPGATTALSHNTLCWNVRPEGPPTPGKDKPGDWYHDHDVPWVEHVKRPRLHLQIGWDQTLQKITDTRGMVTAAADTPGAALVEGQVKVLALTEVPTRADYSPAMMAQFSTPKVPIKAPFTWTRR
ncbi:MAG TPA: hypothetical protein PK794_06445, partial [Armatimonadota bacterium]|nr:hypothetical protein [Armatimonadota bacterium]